MFWFTVFFLILVALDYFLFPWGPWGLALILCKLEWTCVEPRLPLWPWTWTLLLLGEGGATAFLMVVNHLNFFFGIWATGKVAKAGMAMVRLGLRRSSSSNYF
jgi:hypothetical protein